MRQHISFEMNASGADLLALAKDVTGFAIGRLGRRLGPVWIRTGDGTLRHVGVAQRDLETRFEVFTLQVDSEAALKALAAPHDPPTPPETFEPWPFQTWRTDVLRRAEFIVKGASGPAFGADPDTQGAAPPSEVPQEAYAACEVAVGLIFSDSTRRLLVGVDWFPFAMVVTEDAAMIDDYASCCETVSVGDYVSRLAR